MKEGFRSALIQCRTAVWQDRVPCHLAGPGGSLQPMQCSGEGRSRECRGATPDLLWAGLAPGAALACYEENKEDHRGDDFVTNHCLSTDHGHKREYVTTTDQYHNAKYIIAWNRGMHRKRISVMYHGYLGKHVIVMCYCIMWEYITIKYQALSLSSTMAVLGSTI